MENSGIARLDLHKTLLVEQGSYYMVQNPTPGTGFAQPITAAYSATSAFITIFNGAAAFVAGGKVANAKNVYVDYIRLINSAVGASSTAGHLVCALDNGNRYSSGTASTPTPYNIYLGGGSSATVVQVGPLVTTATAAVILLGHTVLRVATAPAWVVYDEVVIHFGAREAATESAVITATTQTRLDAWMPPVVVGPQQTFLVQPFNVANAVTAPSFEYEIGWWER